MSVNDLALMADSLKDNPNFENWADYRNLFNQLNSSSESISTLLPLYPQTENLDSHLVVLKIVYNRIYNFWYEIKPEIQNQLLDFFFNGMLISNQVIIVYINAQRIDILMLVSKCQAILASHFYPEPFLQLWEIVNNFLDLHFYYFVAFFYSSVSIPNLRNLTHYQKIREAMLGVIDNGIFQRIISNVQNNATAILALSHYTKWGQNFRTWFETKEIFDVIIGTSIISRATIELFHNTISRLNVEADKIILIIPLPTLIDQIKTMIQNNNQNFDIIHSTAALINNIIITLQRNPQILQEINILDYLLYFLSIQDYRTTESIIPSLTFYMQNFPQDPTIMQKVLDRLILYFRFDLDINIGEDFLVKSICNVISKADPNMTISILKTMIDDPKFLIMSDFTTAVLAALSYISYIPLDLKFYTINKANTAYQNLTPASSQDFYRIYYLLLLLQNMYIPLPQDQNLAQTPEQQQQISQMNEQSNNLIQTIYQLLSQVILQQLPAIANRELNFQYLKIVRKLISKVRAFNLNFDPALAQSFIAEMMNLQGFTDEAAKCIAYLINNENISFLQQILQQLNEGIQNKNFPVIGFSLVLISSLKYLNVDEEIAQTLIKPILDVIHSILTELNYRIGNLVGLLLKAYVIVSPFIFPILPQLLQLNLDNDLYTFNCSCLLVNNVLHRCQGADLSWFPPYLMSFAEMLSTNFLIIHQTPDQIKVFRELSTNYCSLLKTYFILNKGQNIEQVFASIAPSINSQFDVGYNHSCFVERLTDALITFINAGCPPEAISTNILLYSLCFLFNPRFNHAFIEDQKLMETVIKLHAFLIKSSLNEFKAKFLEFLTLFNCSQLTLRYFENYMGLLIQTDINNIDELVHNSFFTLFFYSIISDRNSSQWLPLPQS